MLETLRKVPMAICGLILGIASMGNLFVSENAMAFSNVWGVVAMILIIPVLLKLFFTGDSVWQELNNPMSAATMPTFTMALMVIATFWGRWGFHTLGLILWCAAIALHLFITGAFIYLHLLKPEVGIQHVYPSWFVTFVGIGVVPVTAGQFIPSLGRILLYVALAFYVVLLPIVLWRLYKYKDMPEGALPLITITAAPASLCLTGYLFSFSQINIIFAVALGLLAQLLYFSTVLTMLRIYISSKHSLLHFFPSFAAFTFPMVISSTGLYLLSTRLPQSGLTTAGTWLAYVEQGFAVIVILFVLVQYGRFLSQNVIQHASTKAVEQEIKHVQ